MHAFAFGAIYIAVHFTCSLVWSTTVDIEFCVYSEHDSRRGHAGFLAEFGGMFSPCTFT